MNFINNVIIMIIFLFYQIKLCVCFSRYRTTNCLYSVWMFTNLRPMLIMLFVFFCNINIPKHFFAWFYYIDRLNFFFFIYYIFNCSICIGFCWIVFVSIDCFLLSSLALNAILVSSVHALCFSVLNLCFFYDFFMIFSYTICITFIFFLVVYLFFKLICF